LRTIPCIRTARDTQSAFPDRASQSLAGFGLVALYVAVFPANIYMAVANVQVQGLSPWLPQPSAGALWARLPLQLVFIGWALRVSEIWKPRES
jgi:uncharacterized membrane protein